MAELTHLDNQGQARMVDVSDKDNTRRSATAYGFIKMSSEVLDLIVSGGHKKGDVLATARIAGIMAAKKTPYLIPMCHPLLLTVVEVVLNIDRKNQGIEIIARCQLQGQTGVEMEALTAVSVSALTLYDMCKAVDKGMVISQIKLLKKSGGRSGDYFSDK